MRKNKRKQTKSLISVLLACFIILAIYLLEANGIPVLPKAEETAQVAQVAQTVLSEEVQAQEINLQDENLHVIFWDVGQADCILVQNNRRNNVN